MIEKENCSHREFIVSEKDGVKRIKFKNNNCKNSNCCNNYILDVEDEETGNLYDVPNTEHPAKFFVKGLPYGGPNTEKYYLSEIGKKHFKLQD